MFELVDHLFRREAGKMVPYLARILGLDLAEDVVQDTLCRAMETWPVHGVPENPSAWLMRVARNRAIDMIRRDAQFRYFSPELTHLLKLRENVPAETPAFQNEIRDDQLRMMFSCCHPQLSTDSQVTLILKTLCGFSVGEIANALLVSEESVEKRLGRAKKLFRDSGAFEEFTDAALIPERLNAIHQAIYLLFNEGYHGSQSEQTVRDELCFEAIRLALLLSEHPRGNQPATVALLALMCFHASRLTGRVDADGTLVQLENQDRSRWDRELIGRGLQFLERSSVGNELSEFHLQAAIASLHCSAVSYDQTDWAKIVELYDELNRINPSSIVALNRAVAFGNARGPEAGLAELGRIPDAEQLREYPFYPAAQGEFLLLAGRREEAREFFDKAEKLARSPSEAKFFAGRLKSCRPGQAQTNVSGK